MKCRIGPCLLPNNNQTLQQACCSFINFNVKLALLVVNVLTDCALRVAIIDPVDHPARS